MTNFDNGQSKEIQYLSDTGVECRVCGKNTMRVRQETKGLTESASLTQHLECPTCGEHYPRTVGQDRKTVLHDPFEKRVHL